MDRAAIQTVRAFNRLVGERIGALNSDFLGRHRPMGESRTLWEIGPDGVEVRQLRRGLGLDSGYMTRMLRSLESQRLIKVESARDDGRVRIVRLTKSGGAERGELERRSAAVASSFLEPLSQQQRTRLVTAMEEIERLLRASLVTMAVEKPATPDARWCMQQYFRELNARFERGFDPARSISADAHELVPPAGAFLIARLRGRPVGCGAVKFHRGAPAALKRMWVAPDARGLGLGRRLLVELEWLARRNGVSTVRLETNRALQEAIALYRSAGYREVKAFNDEPYAHHWFQKRLVTSSPGTRPSRGIRRGR